MSIIIILFVLLLLFNVVEYYRIVFSQKSEKGRVPDDQRVPLATKLEATRAIIVTGIFWWLSDYTFHSNECVWTIIFGFPFYLGSILTIRANIKGPVSVLEYRRGNLFSAGLSIAIVCAVIVAKQLAWI